MGTLLILGVVAQPLLAPLGAHPNHRATQAIEVALVPGRPSPRPAPGGRHDGIFVEDFEYIAGSGDLDECSGRFGVTPEFPDGTYHYVLTEDFPYVPRAFRGTPDPSFLQRGPRPGAR